jgi:hypothetical protein
MTEIVYKIPGKNAGPEGKTYDWKPVKSEDEFERAIKEGWFDTLAEAINGKPKELVRARNNEGQYIGDDPETPENEAYIEAPPTRSEMEAKAKELGIKYKKNLSDKKLLKKIEDKLKG